MRISNVIFLNDYGCVNGGTSKIAISEAIELKRRGLEVVFFCGVEPIDPTLDALGIKVICTRQKDILHENRLKAIFTGVWNTKARIALKSILAKYSPNDTVIHIHGWTKCLSPSVLNVGDKMGFKTYITLHDFFLYCPNGGLFNYQKCEICSIKPMSAKCMFTHCDARNRLQKYWRVLRQLVQNQVLKKNHRIQFISISKLSDRLFIENRPLWQNRLRRIDNLVDFTNNISGKLNERDHYLFIGRLSEEKGAKLFLEAMKQLKLKGEVWGDGYQMDELVKNFPDAIFRGWVNANEKQVFLSNIKALVFPSIWYETFGLVVAEMLANNIPCIVGNKTAAAELIKEGKNGYLFETGNLDSIKSAILKMEKSHGDLSPLKYFETNKYAKEYHIERLMSYYTEICSTN